MQLPPSIPSALSIFLLAISLTVSPAAEPTRIAREHRVANIGNGFCGWCAVETLGRHLKIERLHGLVERKHARLGDDGGGTWQQDLRASLRRLDVRYRYQPEGTCTLGTLQTYCQAYGGVVVGYRTGPDSGHFVVALSVGDAHIRYIDSNHPKSVWRMSRKEFLRCWYRDALAIVP